MSNFFVVFIINLEGYLIKCKVFLFYVNTYYFLILISKFHCNYIKVQLFFYIDFKPQNSLISSSSFYIGASRFPTHMIMSFVNELSLFFFVIYMPFIFYSYIISLGGVCGRRVFDGSGKHQCASRPQGERGLFQRSERSIDVITEFREEGSHFFLVCREFWSILDVGFWQVLICTYLENNSIF